MIKQQFGGHHSSQEASMQNNISTSLSSYHKTSTELASQSSRIMVNAETGFPTTMVHPIPPSLSPDNREEIMPSRRDSTIEFSEFDEKSPEGDKILEQSTLLPKTGVIQKSISITEAENVLRMSENALLETLGLMNETDRHPKKVFKLYAPDRDSWILWMYLLTHASYSITDTIHGNIAYTQLPIHQLENQSLIVMNQKDNA